MNINKKILSISFNKDIQYKPILFSFSKTNTAQPYFCKNMYKTLDLFKCFISNNEIINKWDFAKKLSNNYELININNSNSITSIKPISRSFYKFIELITDFELINQNIKSIRYSALAEGPGGFIEGFINYRKKNFLGKYDYIQCMTLKSKSKDIPNWEKAKKNFNLFNINYCYGYDNTGNIYDINNIKYFRNKMKGNTSHIVSADGGFDYSVNFSKQEQQSYKLIYAEIVCCYGVCKQNGHFILKIFDFYTLPTLKIIHLLGLFFKEINFIKPHTSRPANSEKYLVCKYFKGFKQEIFNNLIYNLDKWNKLGDNYNLIDIRGISLSNSYLYNLSLYNKVIVENQIKNILKTLIFIKLKIETYDLEYIRKYQVLYSITWCLKYKIFINLKNKLLWF